MAAVFASRAASFASCSASSRAKRSLARASIFARASASLAQALLAPRQFVGDRHAVGNVRLVRRLGLGHQIGHLGLQLRLDLARMLIGQRAVPAGVGVDLRAVERHRAHLQHAHLARQQQHLNEQRLDLLQKPPPERRDRVVVGMVVRRDEAERHRSHRSPAPACGSKTPPSHSRKPECPAAARMIGRRTGAAIAAAHRATGRARRSPPPRSAPDAVSGSHSSTDGGSRNPVSRSIGRKLLMPAVSVILPESC